MKFACSMLTQNPKALIRRTSVTLSRSAAENYPKSCVVTRVQVGQLTDVVSDSALPPHGREVRAIADPEVLERCQQTALECFPQPELNRDPAIEPAEYVAAISALRGRGQPEQHLGLQMSKERRVRLGLGARVVKLVDHDHVEMMSR